MALTFCPVIGSVQWRHETFPRRLDTAPESTRGGPQWPAPRVKPSASADYHMFPWASAALQPPWPAFEHVRVLTPVVGSLVIVNVVVDFDVATTV